MFEAEIERERRHGLRGPFTKYFAPLDSTAASDLARKDAAYALLGIAALWLLFGLRSYPMLLYAALTGPVAYVLLRSRSQGAAGCLLSLGSLFVLITIGGVAAGGFVSPIPALLGVATFFFAFRGFRAARYSGQRSIPELQALTKDSAAPTTQPNAGESHASAHEPPTAGA